MRQQTGEKPIHCQNCQQPLLGAFCHTCGQEASTKRIDWHTLTHALTHALFHMDHSIVFMLKQLMLRPGYAAADYMAGKRKPYYNPLLLLVLLAGICSLVYAAWQLPTPFGGLRLDTLEHKSPWIAHKFFAVRMVLFIGFCSLGDYLLFGKNRYNLPEMLLLNCFIFCGVMLLQLIFAPVRFMAMQAGFELWVAGIQLMLQVVYAWWGRVQFFEAYQQPIRYLLLAVAVLCYLLAIGLTGRYVVAAWLG